MLPVRAALRRGVRLIVSAAALGSTAREDQRVASVLVDSSGYHESLRAQVISMKPRIKAKTIDEYLAALDADKRAALEKLRKTIRAAAPKAQECISYQLPAFRLGEMLAGFGATESHCAFYLMSSTTVERRKDELAAYDTSKGTIRLQPAKPLPTALVRKLVKARIAENEGDCGTSA